MKVNNQNVLEPKQLWIVPPQEGGSKRVPFSLGENDVHALRKLMSSYNLHQYDEVILKAISERDQIKELTLSKTGRHMNHGYVNVEPELFNQLTQEAERLGLYISEYIRGIIYSRNEQRMHEAIAKREAEEQRRRDNRVIGVNLSINKEIREKLYKKYGRIPDKELQEKVREDVLKYLAE